MTLKSVTRNKTGNGAEAFERARIFVGSLQLTPDGPPHNITNYYNPNISSDVGDTAAQRKTNQLRITTVNGFAGRSHSGRPPIITSRENLPVGL